MTRTPKEAEQGKLNLILGGDESDIDTVMPLLRCFADTITTAGPVGAGHGLKLIHNYVSLGYAAILAEAAAAARADGIDTDIFVHVLEAGAASQLCWTGSARTLKRAISAGCAFLWPMRPRILTILARPIRPVTWRLR